LVFLQTDHLRLMLFFTIS